MGCRRLAPLLLAFAAGCAGAPYAVSEVPGPPPFQGIRRVALVRQAERDGRAKDPLDAVRESLEQRGLTTRTFEVGRRAGSDLADLERLYGRIELRVDAAAVRQGGARPPETVGGPMTPLLDRLQVDAVALYLRPQSRLLALAPPGLGTGSSMTGPAPAGRRPSGALAVVNREGQLVWFDWGGGEDPVVDAGRPVNAAEAVDALLRVITGEQPEG